MFIAMTAAVVMVTLMGNATTIAFLMKRLRLGEPSIADRVLAGTAILSGVSSAREQLKKWGINDSIVTADLDAVEARTREDLRQLDLSVERTKGGPSSGAVRHTRYLSAAQ